MDTVRNHEDRNNENKIIRLMKENSNNENIFLNSLTFNLNQATIILFIL
jgi:hypothetical protein